MREEELYIAKQLVAAIFYVFPHSTCSLHFHVCVWALYTHIHVYRHGFGVTFFLKVISVIQMLMFGGEMFMFFFLFDILIYWLDDILLHNHLILCHMLKEMNMDYNGLSTELIGNFFQQKQQQVLISEKITQNDSR